MADHRNLGVFQSIYAAFISGDMETLATYFHDDVVWHTPGNNPLAGTYEGRDATFASFAEEFELSGGTYRVEVHDVLANDEHTVALLHATAEREGKRLDENYVIAFHIEEGKVRAAWELWSEQEAVDAFWS